MGFGELLAQGFLGAIGGAGESVKEQSAAEQENKRKIKLLEQALNYKMTPSEISKENAMAKYYEAMAKHAGMGGGGGGGGNPFAAIYAISSLLGGLGKLQGKDAGGYQVTGSSSGSGGYVNPYNYTRQPTR